MTYKILIYIKLYTLYFAHTIKELRKGREVYFFVGTWFDTCISKMKK